MRGSIGAVATGAFLNQSNVPAVREGSVSTELDRQRGLIETLSETVDALEGRLAVVLLQATPTANSATEPQPPICEVGERLTSDNLGLAAIIYRLRELVGRIDL